MKRDKARKNWKDEGVEVGLGYVWRYVDQWVVNAAFIQLRYTHKTHICNFAQIHLGHYRCCYCYCYYYFSFFFVKIGSLSTVTLQATTYPHVTIKLAKHTIWRCYYFSLIFNRSIFVVRTDVLNLQQKILRPLQQHWLQAECQSIPMTNQQCQSNKQVAKTSETFQFPVLVSEVSHNYQYNTNVECFAGFRTSADCCRKIFTSQKPFMSAKHLWKINSQLLQKLTNAICLNSVVRLLIDYGNVHWPTCRVGYKSFRRL